MSEPELKKAWADHSRLWKTNRWVYPVISRRAGGLSIGINVNPDKRCSFNCLYCQVDRTIPCPHTSLDLNAIRTEIETIISAYKQNGLTDFENFKEIPEKKRLIQDFSLSGDGEPTLIFEFPEICKLLREIQKSYSEYPIKLVLITNATMLHLPRVKEGLFHLTEKRGEIWTKLDAGSENWFHKISDSHCSLDQIQKNIEMTIADFPIRIQTMICKVDEITPSENEIDLYCRRVESIYKCRPENLFEVQLYGLIRHPNTKRVSPLPSSFLEEIADKLSKIIPVKIGVY